MAYKILGELYQMIEEAFLVYFISLPGPRSWKPALENFEQEFRKDLREDGLEDTEIERRLDEKPHIFSDGGFKVQTSAKTARKLLKPGVLKTFRQKTRSKSCTIVGSLVIGKG